MAPEDSSSSKSADENVDSKASSSSGKKKRSVPRTQFDADVLNSIAPEERLTNQSEPEAKVEPKADVANPEQIDNDSETHDQQSDSSLNLSLKPKRRVHKTVIDVELGKVAIANMESAIEAGMPSWIDELDPDEQSQPATPSEPTSTSDSTPTTESATTNDSTATTESASTSVSAPQFDTKADNTKNGATESSAESAPSKRARGEHVPKTQLDIDALDNIQPLHTSEAEGQSDLPASALQELEPDKVADAEKPSSKSKTRVPKTVVEMEIPTGDVVPQEDASPAKTRSGKTPVAKTVMDVALESTPEESKPKELPLEMAPELPQELPPESLPGKKTVAKTVMDGALGPSETVPDAPQELPPESLAWAETSNADSATQRNTQTSTRRLSRRARRTISVSLDRLAEAALADTLNSPESGSEESTADASTADVSNTSNTNASTADAAHQNAPGWEAPPPAAPASTGLASRGLGRRRKLNVSKTLVESDIELIEERLTDAPYMASSDMAPLDMASQNADSAAGAPQEFKPAPYKKRQHQFVARTVLDRSLFEGVIVQSTSKKQAQVEEAREREALEPPKPFVPVTFDKRAKKCAWEWKETGTSVRVKYCDLCQNQVYNFEDLQMPEAEALIVQRENKLPKTIYKRDDGKYMTVDCPVAGKKTNTMVVVISIVAILMLLLVVAFATQQSTPPAPPSDTNNSADGDSNTSSDTSLPQSPTSNTSTGAATGAPNSNSPTSNSTSSNQTSTGPSSTGSPSAKSSGDFHYEAGKGITQQPAPEPPKTETTTTTAPDPDENGQFWQYQNKGNN